jgi:hypothetical protein
MRSPFALTALGLLVSGALLAQDAAPALEAQTTPPKRSWMGRLFHPFSSSHLPQYKDPKLRGLELQLQIGPQPVKLSETRQMQVKVVVTNRGKHAVELNYPTDQRIEIYLRNSAEAILTKWSDNHAISDKPETILVNPDEHVEYVQTIATRELTPDKVFIVEVFFPNYPELRIRQKFLTEP